MAGLAPQPPVRAALAPVSVYVGSNAGSSDKASARRQSVDGTKSGSALTPSKVAPSPASRKRRSQSMGGGLADRAALFPAGGPAAEAAHSTAAMAAAAAAAAVLDLSPRKKARRSLVPGRSILKPAPISHSQQPSWDGTGDYTSTLHTASHDKAIAGAGQASPASSDDDDLQDTDENAIMHGAEMDMTGNLTRRLSRRVSFAPTAQMREFAKDNPEDYEDFADESFSNIGDAVSPEKQVQSAPQPSIYIQGLSNSLNAHVGIPSSAATAMPPSTSASPAKSATGARRRSSSIRNSVGGGHRRRSSVANAQSLVDSMARQQQAQAQAQSQDEQSLINITPTSGDESALISNESAMDLADTSDTTTAFASHFTFPAGPTASNSQETSFAASSTGNASELMDMADDDNVTTAFAHNTHLFGGRTNTSARTSGIFGTTAPSPASKTAMSAEPSTSASALPYPPVSPHRRVSRSPSKKVQQQRRESDLKASREAEAARRRSAIYSHEQQDSHAAGQAEATKHNEYSVPLGQEGVDEEAILRLQQERVRRGSAAFFASRQSATTVSLPNEALFGDATELATASTSTSIFAQFHSQHDEEGGNERGPRISPSENDEDEDQTMDMSLVQDSRRVSNVFAAFAGRRQSAASDVENAAEEDSPSPVKTGSLYPSISKLEQETKHLQSPTPGDRALAFLDEDEEEEEYTADTTVRNQRELVEQQTVESSAQDMQNTQNMQDMQDDAQTQEDEDRQQAEDSEQVPAGQEAPYNPYDFQRHRLSIVPERRDEEDAEAEEDEDEDQTQEMDETQTYGAILAQSQARRLSIAHPSTQATSSAQSPAKSPAKAAPTPSRIPLPSMTSSTGKRRTSFDNLPPPPPTTFTSLNENGPNERQSSMFISDELAAPLPTPPITSMGMSMVSKGLPSPARPIASPARQTGLTPNMHRLASAGANLNLASSPAVPHARQSLAAARESVAPPSDGFFDEQPTHGPESDAAFGDKDRPKISLEQFLSIADMQFMDNLLSVSQAPGASKCKTAGRPSIERAASNPLGVVSLADQISANAAVIPFLEGYRMMATELRNNLRENSHILDELEEQVEEETPALFLDYVGADDEDRAMLDMHFKITRAYYRLHARNEWYGFRHGVSQSIAQMLHSHKENLSADTALIDETYARLDRDHLPGLRERAQELAQQLAKEKSRQQELQDCDQEHLQELRSAIKEQNAFLDEYKRDVSQTEHTLERLQTKQAELDTQAQESTDAILASRKVCDEVRYYTKSEMCRLQDELDLVQYLHGWRLVQFDHKRIELSHREELNLTAVIGQAGTVEDFELVLSEQALQVTPSEDAGSVNRRVMTNFLFERMKVHVVTNVRSHKIKDLLRRIANLWTRARHIRSSFSILALQYPLAVSVFTKKSRAGQPFLRATAHVYAVATRADFNITFELTGEEMLSGDVTNCIQDLGVTVEVRHGNVDREQLSCVVRERISDAGEKALLEACQEAEAHCRA